VRSAIVVMKMDITSMDYPGRPVKDSTDAVSRKLGVNRKSIGAGNVVNGSSYPPEGSTRAARFNTCGECIVGSSYQVLAFLILFENPGFRKERISSKST
jgi:hypothetical protein